MRGFVSYSFFFLCVLHKKWLKQNRVGPVVWLAWQEDTGNGLCSEQTQRLTVAEARETAPPPSSRDGKEACVCECFVFSKGFNLLHSRRHS